MKLMTVTLRVVGMCVLALPAFAATAGDQPMTVNIKRMSLDTALRVGQAAIEKCRKEGVQVAVTVIDRGGQEQVVLRDVLAMPVATEISKKKAYTAMSFNSPTSKLVDRFTGAYGVPKIESLMISPGGVPIVVAGNILGGVGVSGAPSGLTDELCAEAGFAAVRDELEME